MQNKSNLCLYISCTHFIHQSRDNGSGLKMRTLSGIMMLAVLCIVSNVGLAFTSESPSLCNLTTFSWNCTNICNSGSCSYPLLPQMYPDSWHEDCEAAVYTLDELLLAHSSLSTNPTNLSTVYCMDKLLLKITCTNPYYQYQALYRVTNVSSVSAASLASTHSGHLYLLLLLLILVAVIVYL